MTNLTDLNLAEAREGLLKKEFSSVELTEAYIKAMEDARHLNAYITETPELALEQAAKSDKKIASGDAGKMEGIPIAVKDLFCTEGVQSTTGSAILKGFIPTYESTVSQKLCDAGMKKRNKKHIYK